MCYLKKTNMQSLVIMSVGQFHLGYDKWNKNNMTERFPGNSCSEMFFLCCETQMIAIRRELLSFVSKCCSTMISIGSLGMSPWPKLSHSEVAPLDFPVLLPFFPFLECGHCPDNAHWGWSQNSRTNGLTERGPQQERKTKHKSKINKRMETNSEN